MISLFADFETLTFNLQFPIAQSYFYQHFVQLLTKDYLQCWYYDTPFPSPPLPTLSDASAPRSDLSKWHSKQWHKCNVNIYGRSATHRIDKSQVCFGGVEVVATWKNCENILCIKAVCRKHITIWRRNVHHLGKESMQLCQPYWVGFLSYNSRVRLLTIISGNHNKRCNHSYHNHNHTYYHNVISSRHRYRSHNPNPNPNPNFNLNLNNHLQKCRFHQFTNCTRSIRLCCLIFGRR